MEVIKPSEDYSTEYNDGAGLKCKKLGIRAKF